MRPLRSDSPGGSASVAPAGHPGPAELRRIEALIAQGEGSVRALCAAAELGLACQLREAILSSCASTDAKVRSKAVLMLGQLSTGGHGQCGGEASSILSAALGDTDARVRANAIEAIEQSGSREFDVVLRARACHGQSRERANAIKALAGVRPEDADGELIKMLSDRRDAHRLSALWLVEKRRAAHFVEEVARMARDEINVRVRGQAAITLRSILRRMLSSDRQAGWRAA